ncbi:hypothetical protein [Ruegeria aquimaris]|uniref:hypothetical protein n=1 Tax=Ruegeria aquimaris TaxID=2984333 RepID=UPI0021E96135|nr:hypothetical protein [Ruegeria sp. XHP0148]
MVCAICIADALVLYVSSAPVAMFCPNLVPSKQSIWAGMIPVRHDEPTASDARLCSVQPVQGDMLETLPRVLFLFRNRNTNEFALLSGYLRKRLGNAAFSSQMWRPDDP